MPLYQFEAITENGTSTLGNLFASSTAEAVDVLSKRGVTPVRIAARRTWLTTWRGVPLAQQVTWFAVLSDLIAAGMPIVEALELLTERTTNPLLAEATRDLRLRLIDGQSLSQAMRLHPKLFDSLSQNLVSAGEEGAFLDQALNRIATLKDATARVRSRLASAFAYPAFLMVVGTIVLASMMLFFVPRFEPLFQRMRETQGLPWATEWLFAANRGLTENAWIVAILVTVLCAYVWHWITDPRNALRRDRFFLANPAIGSVASGMLMARFCSLLANLLSSGIRIQQATLIAGQAAGNKAIAQAAEKAVEGLTTGNGLADSLQSSGLFPRELIELIRMGEKTNRLEHVLAVTAERLEQRNQQNLDVVLKLIEPILMVVMAMLIGFVMVALLMPIFTANGQSFQ